MGSRRRDLFLAMIGGATGDHRHHRHQVLCRDGSRRPPWTSGDALLRDARSQVAGIVSLGEEFRRAET